MAMIECRECKKLISDQAESCPHCGCPARGTSNVFMNEKSKEFKLGSAMILSGAVIVLIALSIMSYFDGRTYFNNGFYYRYSFWPIWPLGDLSSFAQMIWLLFLAGVIVASIGGKYIYKWFEAKNQK